MDAEISELVRLITERDAAAATAQKAGREAATAAKAEEDASRSAAEVCTPSLDSLRLEGNELLKKGQVAEAIQLYEKCLKLHPGSIPVHANLALAKVRMCLHLSKGHRLGERSLSRSFRNKWACVLNSNPTRS